MTPAPDSPEANKLGCSCPSSNNSGVGTPSPPAEGAVVRSWVINPSCPVHASPRAWMRR